MNFFVFARSSGRNGRFSPVETAVSLAEGKNHEVEIVESGLSEVKRGIFQIPKGVRVAHIIGRGAP